MLLSICIPTYNRAQYLKESLDILLPQLLPLKADVEVLVSDNCSTDNTQEVVERAQAQYSIDLAYTKNEKNIGGNNNMVKVVARAKGEYVYIMGDDDYLSPDFLAILFRLLKRDEDYSLLFFNRLSGDINCSHCHLADPHYQELERIMSPKAFIFDVMRNANFISSIVFKRQCWDLGEAHLKDAEYFGYNWFARIYWGAVEYGKDCIYYYMPLVIQRNGPKTWLKFWAQYLISSMSNIFYDLDEFVPGVYEKWLKQLKKDLPNVLPYVSFYRSYYRQDAVKKMILKHLSTSERIKYYYYLVPGTNFMYRAFEKVKRSFK